MYVKKNGKYGPKNTQKKPASSQKNSLFLPAQEKVFL